MKRWHVTVGDKELECILSRAYPNFNKLVLVADEKMFTITFIGLQNYTRAKNGESEIVMVASMNKVNRRTGYAVFKEVLTLNP